MISGGAFERTTRVRSLLRRHPPAHSTLDCGRFVRQTPHFAEFRAFQTQAWPHKPFTNLRAKADEGIIGDRGVTIGPHCSSKRADMSVVSKVPALLLFLAIGLQGCVTSNAGSPPMDARAEALTPSASRVFMPVEQIPSDPATPALSADEQSKLKKELNAVRDKQATTAKRNHQ